MFLEHLLTDEEIPIAFVMNPAFRPLRQEANSVFERMRPEAFGMGMENSVTTSRPRMPFWGYEKGGGNRC